MRSVKQSLLVLNGVSNWRDGFVNVVRLATSEPERNPKGWTEKYDVGAGAAGRDWGRSERWDGNVPGK